jgi:hypothetical protein
MTKLLRSLLFALLSFVVVSEAAAQARAESSPIRFSVAAGFNLSKRSPSAPVEEDLLDELGIDLGSGSRIGFVAGGLVDFRVAPTASIVTGGLVSTRGGRLDVDVPGFGNLELDTRMIYVDVPAFVAVGVGRWGQNRLELLGGPMLGITVQGKQKLSGLGLSEEEEFTDELPAVDFGLSFGGRFSCGHIFAAAYYTWGFTDLTEGDAPEPVKHRYLTVVGGWRF